MPVYGKKSYGSMSQGEKSLRRNVPTTKSYYSAVSWRRCISREKLQWYNVLRRKASKQNCIGENYGHAHRCSRVWVNSRHISDDNLIDDYYQRVYDDIKLKKNSQVMIYNTKYIYLLAFWTPKYEFM